MLPPKADSPADVPANTRGMSWADYEREQLDACALEARRKAPKPTPEQLEIKTSRDNYGWRSLPHGSRYFAQR
jgi:hypothetical protein